MIAVFVAGVMVGCAATLALGCGVLVLLRHSPGHPPRIEPDLGPEPGPDDAGAPNYDALRKRGMDDRAIREVIEERARRNPANRTMWD